LSVVIALAWPAVALIAVLYVGARMELLFSQRQLLSREFGTLATRVEALEAVAKTEEDACASRYVEAHKRLDKLERLNQGVPPKGERHTPEHLARFR
jgi:hypothetical protein